MTMKPTTFLVAAVLSAWIGTVAHAEMGSPE